MSAKPRLHSVPSEPVKRPAPDTSYEAEQRRRIMSRDWSAVHVQADRRLPFATIMGRFFR